MTITLSTIRPDHEDIKAQLEAYLSTTNTWKGVVESQTGQAIINLVAAIGTYDQATLRRYFEDCFPETVVSDEASYAIADMQGVRLTRKLPASVAVNLTSTITMTLPAYSVFQGGGSFFFNRQALFFNAGVPQSAVLNEGRVINLEIAGLSQDYSMFVSKESAFSISDVDVQVLLNNAPMARETGGPWTLRDRIGFVDSTIPEGRLLIQFGTPQFGGRPLTTDNLKITYVVTKGSGGNNLDTATKNVVSTEFPVISGTFTTNPTGGADERPALTYKNLSAPTFGVFDSAITRRQYLTTALNYPGVVDVLTFAQREVNPSAKEWMNLVKMVLLTNSPWSPTQKQEFLDWFQSKSSYLPQVFIEDPLELVQDISMEIFCYNWVNSTQARLKAEEAVRKLLEPRAGILNYDLHLTDITDAILEAEPGIEYITMINPTESVILSLSPLPAPLLTEALTGGTLLSDTDYSYGLAVTTASGILTVRNLATRRTTSSTSTITNTWKAYPGAVSYQLYRKVGVGALELVYSGTNLSYIDTGAASIGGAPPATSTIPVRYIKLGNLNIVERYSTRSLRT